MNFGANAWEGQSERARNALVVKHSSVPNLDGFRKDHKRCDDPIRGPPLRPLCNAKVGPNANCANMQCRFLKVVRHGVNEKIDTEVLSTEEVCHHILKLNEKYVQELENKCEPLQRANKMPKIQTSGLVVGSIPQLQER